MTSTFLMYIEMIRVFKSSAFTNDSHVKAFHIADHRPIRADHKSIYSDLYSFRISLSHKERMTVFILCSLYRCPCPVSAHRPRCPCRPGEVCLVCAVWSTTQPNICHLTGRPDTDCHCQLCRLITETNWRIMKMGRTRVWLWEKTPWLLIWMIYHWMSGVGGIVLENDLQ